MKWSNSLDTLTAKVTANAMAFEFNSESLKALIQFKASMATYLRHSTYQRTRPQVGFDFGVPGRLNLSPTGSSERDIGFHAPICRCPLKLLQQSGGSMPCVALAESA